MHLGNMQAAVGAHDRRSRGNDIETDSGRQVGAWR